MYGLVTFILLWSATLTSWGKTTQLVTLTPSPCHVDSDPNYKNGIRVNCQRQGISSLPLPSHWLPPHNVTSLLLDANVITELNKDAFASSLRDSQCLRVLGLSSNRISSISPNVFSQFESLRTLELQKNFLSLDRESLDGQVFNGLGKLTELYLAGNSNSQRAGAYNESLFSDLVAMETVSLDTFRGNLSLGSLFRNSVRLATLELVGGVNRITNRSFEGFLSHNLTQLTIRGAGALYNIETGAFKNLRALTKMEVSDSSIDMKSVLESLAPYAYKNMSHLILSDLSYSYKQSNKFLRNSVLTRHMARFLSTVCVENFVLANTFVFIVETGVFTNPVWRRCLKSMSIIGNPLQGEINEFVRLASLRNLEYLRTSGRKYVWANRPFPYLWKPAACMAKIDVSPKGSSLPHSYETMDEISHPGSSLPHAYDTMDEISQTGPSLPHTYDTMDEISQTGPSLPHTYDTMDEISHRGSSLPHTYDTMDEISHTGSSLLHTYDTMDEISHRGSSLPHTYDTMDEISQTGPSLPHTYDYDTVDDISHTGLSLPHTYTPAKGEIHRVSETKFLNTEDSKTRISSGSRHDNQPSGFGIPTLIESSLAVPKGMHTEQNIGTDVVKGEVTSTIYFPIPPGLKVAVLNCDSFNFGKMKSAVHLMNGDHVQEMHLADNGIRNFVFPCSGLKSIKVLDISRNDASIMSSTFLDSLSSVLHLNMAYMKLDVNFMAGNSKRLFYKLSNLRTLDLSYNSLLHLTEDTFATSAKLCVINLQGNRFESIPVDMMNVPVLSHLDLRGNSLKLLSNTEMASLDSHFEETGLFSLSLQGNEFDCGCESLRFLSWLHRTKISLDNARSYMCVLDNGQRTTIGQIDDLDVIWRNCHGQNAFWISLTLACFMMLGYVCCFMIPKLKTQLKAIILKALWIPFVMRTSADYPIGVYIAYADEDTTLACRHLRQFIEDKLHLSTYIRHRDLLPASDMAQSIMEAIHSSWRVLLVVSQHFLKDPWSYYVLKASTYAVQSDNPGRIVLAFVDADGRVMSKLPDCVLRAVREESIVTMTSCGKISYEDKQAFKTAILHNT